MGKKEDDRSVGDKIGHYCSCPPHGWIARMEVLLLTTLLIYGATWAMTGKEALPGGNLFGIFTLVVLAVIASWVVAFVSFEKLPPLLGMLIIGFILRNFGPCIWGQPSIFTDTYNSSLVSITSDTNVSCDLVQDPECACWSDLSGQNRGEYGIKRLWASHLRTVALVVILIKAGIGLDPKALANTKWVALLLAFLPSMVECVIAAICAVYLPGLGYAWTWAFVLGFVLAAVSPAVVVPSMIAIEEKRLGTDKGIPTLLIAACSINDVIAISGFSITLGITFSIISPGDGDQRAKLILNIFHGPIEIVMGIVYGLLMGVIFWFLPHKTHKEKTYFRFLCLLGAGLFAVFGSKIAGYKGAGALGVLIMAFVAGQGWRRREGNAAIVPLKGVLTKLWKIFQPLLFALIGREIAIEYLTKGHVIGMLIAILFIALIPRVIVAFLSSYLKKDFNIKERLFIMLSWLPKATVQAAIGPIAYDEVVKLIDDGKLTGAEADEAQRISMDILVIAALSILITAPIGAGAIGLTAPYFLNKEAEPVEENDKKDQEMENAEDADEIRYPEKKEMEKDKSNGAIPKDRQRGEINRGFVDGHNQPGAYYRKREDFTKV